MTVTLSISSIKRMAYGIIAIGLLSVASVAFALSKDDIVFPVDELGGCASHQECKVYCEQSINQPTCFEFAKKYNILTEEKVEKVEKLRNALNQDGPGGCRSERQCDNYCDKVLNMKECVSFAKRHGIKSGQELEKMEKLSAALESGSKMPGGCTDQKSCEAYCEDTDNMKECIKFGEKTGFMDKREVEEAKKFLPLMEKGETPGGCKSKRQCEDYCDQDGNFEECISFAEKAGLIPAKEAEMVRKTGGKGPGGCKGRRECDSFCNNPDNQEACFNFGVENGMISPEEAKMIKKVGFGPGPGGCKGKEECDAFCGNIENNDACVQFAIDHELISPEEVEKIKQLGGPGAFKGPGGCMGPKECEAYCAEEEHYEECGQFGGGPVDGDDPNQRMGQGFGGPAFMGPGGCESPEECKKFCKNPDNSNECGKFISGPPPGFNGDPPGQGEFAVPPGFVPSGIENIRNDIEDAKQDGDTERVKKLEQMLRGDFNPQEGEKPGIFGRIKDKFRNGDAERNFMTNDNDPEAPLWNERTEAEQRGDEERVRELDIKIQKVKEERFSRQEEFKQEDQDKPGIFGRIKDKFKRENGNNGRGEEVREENRLDNGEAMREFEQKKEEIRFEDERRNDEFRNQPERADDEFMREFEQKDMELRREFEQRMEQRIQHDPQMNILPMQDMRPVQDMRPLQMNIEGEIKRPEDDMMNNSQLMPDL